MCSYRDITQSRIIKKKKMMSAVPPRSKEGWGMQAHYCYVFSVPHTHAALFTESRPKWPTPPNNNNFTTQMGCPQLKKLCIKGVNY